MKTCRICGVEKSLADFPKRKGAKDGTRNDCKVCFQAYQADWSASNRDKTAAYNIAYAARHPERVKELRRKAKQRIRAKDPEKLRAAYRIWWLANKDKAAEATRRWREAHPERQEVYLANRREKKPWRNRDPAAVRAKTRRYQMQRRQACPPWLTQEHHAQMQEKYREAVRLEKETGIKHHVDHVFPLKGKNFCGLHVPWNLQIIPAARNISKNNRVTPEMLAIVEVFQ